MSKNKEAKRHKDKAHYQNIKKKQRILNLPKHNNIVTRCLNSQPGHICKTNTRLNSERIIYKDKLKKNTIARNKEDKQ